MPIAKNIDEFNEQARDFVARAKANGGTNTGIMNTLKFKYAQFLQEQENKITPYEQAQLDLERQGRWQLVDTNNDGIIDTEYNPQTGESRPYTAAGTNIEPQDPISRIYAQGPTTQSGFESQDANMSIMGQEDVISSQPTVSLDNDGQLTSLNKATEPPGLYDEALSQLPENQISEEEQIAKTLPKDIPVSYDGTGRQVEANSNGQLVDPVTKQVIQGKVTNPGFITNLYNAVPDLSWLKNLVSGN